jgi:hypothetical protein
LDTPAAIISKPHEEIGAAMWKIVAVQTDVFVKSGAAIAAVAPLTLL